MATNGQKKYITLFLGTNGKWAWLSMRILWTPLMASYRTQMDGHAMPHLFSVRQPPWKRLHTVDHACFCDMANKYEKIPNSSRISFPTVTQCILICCCACQVFLCFFREKKKRFQFYFYFIQIENSTCNTHP